MSSETSHPICIRYLDIINCHRAIPELDAPRVSPAENCVLQALDDVVGQARDVQFDIEMLAAKVGEQHRPAD